MITPKTGARCKCKPGIWRDNCPNCEGTGEVIDFKALRTTRTGDCDVCKTYADDLETDPEGREICGECGE